MRDVRELHEAWLEDPAYRAEHGALEGEFALARALIEARTRAGLTQEEVARRMKTTQSVVARLEAGQGNPSTRTLRRYAEATGTRLRILLEPSSTLGARSPLTGPDRRSRTETPAAE
jgi:transcriptional regulator with XRE-family HTH domain